VLAAVGVLLLLYISLSWQLRIPAVTTGNDDATYLHLARAIAGFSYRELWVMGEPIHSQYPPFYPFVLAVTGFLSQYRLDAYLLVNAVFVLVALLLMFDAVRRLWSPGLALLMLAMVVANPALVRLGGNLMSEASFLALSSLVLWIPTRQPSERKWLAAFGAAAILAALTRSIGITLLGAVFLYWVWERRWRPLLAFSLAAVSLVGSWLAWTALAPHEVHGGRSYLTDVAVDSAERGLFLTLVGRLGTRVPDYVSKIFLWELPLPVTPATVADNVFWVLLLVGLGCLGLVSVWRRWRIGALYLILYCGLLAVYPWVVGRFLVPIMPLMVVVLLAGTDLIRRRFNAPLGIGLALGLVLVVFVTGTHENVSRLQDLRDCDRSMPLTSPGCFNPNQRSLFAATRFVAANSSDSAVVVTSKDATFSYYSGRRSIRPRSMLSDNPAVFISRVVEGGAGYVFLGRNASLEFGAYSEMLWGACRSLELVESFPPWSHLFRLGSEVAPDTTSAACRALAQFRATLPRPTRSQARP
jgi:hypothetical protein